MTYSMFPCRMVRHFVILLVWGLFCPIAAAQQVGIQWESDFETAKARAATENKPLLLHFYGDYCPPCKLMERDVFPDAKVGEKINAGFVAVKINTTQQTPLSSAYGIRFMPTDIYLLPDGEELHRRVGGKVNPEEFLAEVELVVAKLPKSQPIMQQQPRQIAQQPVIQQTIQPQVTQQSVAQQSAYNFADYAMNAPPAYSQAALSQTAAQDEAEGFAVSGNALASQYHVLPQNMASNNTLPNNMPLNNIANVPANMMSDTNVSQPMAAYTPNVTVENRGIWETDTIRKQPAPGLGAGVSLGIVTATSDKPVTPQMPIVALDGYCAVSLSQQAKWIKGNTEITTEYDGTVFRFASVEAQNAFFVNPELYAPALRGIDVVELLTSRREVTGSRKFGGWYHGRVFLFTNAENYEKFQNNPDLYAFQITQPTKTLATAYSVQRPTN